MLYVLHHSTGALMLKAEDRDQVLEWSERQLGDRAGLVSISESIGREELVAVEKDGTGIGYGIDKGCHPVMGIMADLTQDVYLEQGCSASREAVLPGTRMGMQIPTWH